MVTKKLRDFESHKFFPRVRAWFVASTRRVNRPQKGQARRAFLLLPQNDHDPSTKRVGSRSCQNVPCTKQISPFTEASVSYWCTTPFYHPLKEKFWFVPHPEFSRLLSFVKLSH
jgi:hypothetical protein